MDSRREIRDFLTSRRAKVTVEQAGLRSYGARRVPGLRRSEVAQLAGVSVEYYSRLERGDLAGVSDAVLDALSRALHLDEAERTHLYALARDGGAPPPRRRRAAPTVRSTIQQLLDSMNAPAFVMNARGDVLATNPLGGALYAPLLDSPTSGGRAPNHARFIFLDPASRDFWVDWNRAANDTVALLNAAAARDPYDRELTDLIGELSTRSDDFRSRWAKHDVRQHHLGSKSFRHPVVGELHLTFESLALLADEDLTLLAYGAEPDSDADERLRLLASWAAPPSASPPASHPEPRSS